MQIAVIGGGIAGLTAAYDLAQQYFNGQPPQITIYEGNEQLGGLAAGFKGRSTWEWPLEHFYHHLFTNDDAIINFTKELGLGDLLQVHDRTTVYYYQGRTYPLDTPLRVLRFPHLSLFNRLRMGAVLAYLKFHPRPPWQTFDQTLAGAWMARWMGQAAYATLWQPMLEGKFAQHYNEVNLAWFWARIYKRTKQLIYYRGGFQAFIDGLAQRVRALGVQIHSGTFVTGIQAQREGGFRLAIKNQPGRAYDLVLSTVSPGLMQQLAPDLSADYLGQLHNLKSMGAVVLTVALDRRLMENIYWVNVPANAGLPFLALVEHTDMIDSSHYAGDHLLYLGNYLDPDHRYFAMSTEQLVAEFTPHLIKFNPAFKPDWITGAWVHKEKYAQPVPPVNYLSMIPPLRTPLPGLYFASMSQVYPWDRGTNYAVEMGRKVAGMMVADQT